MDAIKVGVDIIEIERVRRALERPSFRDRCFTGAERAYCDSRADPAQSYAARFAGKEAVGKALGCGVRFTWKEIEIVGRPKPSVSLSGRTAAFAERVALFSIVMGIALLLTGIGFLVLTLGGALGWVALPARSKKTIHTASAAT